MVYKYNTYVAIIFNLCVIVLISIQATKLIPLLLAIFNTKVVPYMMSLKYILPFIELVALLWAFWDPTYSLQFKSRVQGRPIRVEGRKIYIVSQLYNRFASIKFLICLSRYYKA